MAHSTDTEIRPSAGAQRLPRGRLWWRDGRSICSCGGNQNFGWKDGTQFAIKNLFKAS